MDGECCAHGLIDAFYNELYGLTIGKFYNTAQLAYYNKANQIPKLLMTNIDGSISTVMLPALASEQDNKEHAKYMVRRAIKTSIFLLFPMMFGLAAVSESLVKLLLTEKWLPAVPLMQLLCFSYALWPIHSINLQAVSANGRSDIFLRLEILKKAIGLICLIISIPLGIKAMVIIQLVVSIISAFINSYPNKKLINYSWKEQLKDILPCLLVSLFMYIVVYSLNFIQINYMIKMILQVIIGVVIYICTQIVLKTEEYTYFIKGLKKKGEKKRLDKTIKEKIKYIHIMSHISTVYNAQIVYMINENEESFDKEQHLFIISNLKVYEPLKKYKNVIFIEDISNDVKKIKKYANMCEYIFLHSNTLSTKTLLFLNRKILNKIIWCEWGHDLYDNRENPKTLYRKIRRILGNAVRFLPDYIRKKKIQQYYAIGIGFQYDAIEVRRRFGKDMKIVMTPYGYIKDNKRNIDNIINSSKKENEFKRIMVGHSAYEFLNHKKLLNKLTKYKNENIKISLVLAYGSKVYAEEVKEEAMRIFDEEKIEIIDKMMSQEEYIEYLSSVDICLLDYKHQAALGNIYFLLYMGKKLFLNKDGIIKLFSMLENIETYNVEDIDGMSYKEFSQEIKNATYGKQFAEFHINEINYINLWRNSIKDLEKNETIEKV